jgi:hypothetical protein
MSSTRAPTLIEPNASPATWMAPGSLSFAGASAGWLRAKGMANERKPRPFVLRWRSAVLNSTGSASAKLTLLALAEFANADGTDAMPGLAKLAAMTSQNEKTCRRALDEAEGIWLTRAPVKLRGKDWRAYRYTLTLPEGAGTESAGNRTGAGTESGAYEGRSGHSRPKVRTLTPYGAGTESTVLGRAPRKKHLGEGSEKPPLLTLQEFLDQKPKGERFLPLEDPLFEFVEAAGIPEDYHYLAWKAFLVRFKASKERCADWQERYRRAIREDWSKLWRIDRESGQYVLTMAGEQMDRFVEGASH